MKKIYWIIFLIIFVLLGGAAFFFFRPVYLGFESFVSKEALMYAKLSNVQENVEKFRATQFFQLVKEINFRKAFMTENGLDPRVAYIDGLIAQMTDSKSVELFKKYMGQEVAIVSYPVKDMKDDVSLVKFLSGSVFLTRVGADAKAIEFVSSLLGAKEGLLKSTYQLISYYSLKIPELQGEQMCFAVIKDVLILGIGSEGVKKSIDVYRKKIKSLSEHADYQTVVLKDEELDDLLIYFNAQELIDFMDDQFSDQELGGKTFSKKDWQQFLIGESGVKTIGLSAQFASLTQVKANIFLDKDSMSQDLVENFNQCKSKENKSLLFIPEGISYYQWDGCFSLEHSWETATEELSKVQGQTNQIDGIEQMLGLSIEDDLIPVLGQEVGGFLSGVDLSSKFPIPQAVVFAQIKDQVKFQELVSKVFQKLNITLQSEDYLNKKVEFMSTPLGESIEPSFTYLDDYLILAVNRNTLKTTVDTYMKQTSGLQNSDGFKSIPWNVDGSVGMQVVDSYRLLGAIDSVIDWMSQRLGKGDEKKEAFENGSRMRLKDLEEKNRLDQKLIKELTQEIKKLENSLTKLISGGPEYLTLQEQIISFREKLRQTSQESLDQDSQVEELKTLVAGYDKESVKIEQNKLKINEALRPFIRALQSFEYFGQETTIVEPLMKINMFLKVK